MRPAKDDIASLAIFADHDISSVVATQAQANPGSRRRFSPSDALYVGGFLNQNPTQYIYFAGGIYAQTPGLAISGNATVGSGWSGSFPDAHRADAASPSVAGIIHGPVLSFNAAFFTNLTAQIENTDSCAELQETVDQAFAQLADVNAFIATQQALLAPLAGLLTPPTDLASCISWITGTITVFTNMYAPYAKYATQLTELTAAVAALTTAINDAATRIGGGCSITIPPI